MKIKTEACDVGGGRGVPSTCIMSHENGRSRSKRATTTDAIEILDKPIINRSMKICGGSRAKIDKDRRERWNSGGCILCAMTMEAC